MDLGTLWGSIGLNDGPFQAGLANSLTRLNGWKGSALKIAGVVGAGFGAIAAGGFLKNSISSFADFESNLNQLQAATNAPKAAMKDLSDLAMQMGKDTVFSAGEASAAMLELAKAGMTPAQIKGGALAATLKLAAAGGVSLESAATTAANAMNMFGLKASDASSVANALAGGANASSASVESLAQGLSQVGPGAKNAGLSLQETVAVLAAFDNVGIKGSDAGTSLKTMLSALIPTSGEAAEAMKEVGLMTEDGTNAFINADGSFKNITQIAGILDKQLSHLSESQRKNALDTIFGSDASRAAAALMEAGTEGIRKNIRATNDKAAADKMAESRMKGLKGAIESLGGSVETLGLGLVSMIGPGLTAAVKGFAGALNTMGDALSAVSLLVSRHSTTAKIIAAVIGVVLLPAFIAWATFATIAAVATVRAWATSAAGAVASGATQLLWMTTMGLKFIWLGIQALASAAKQAAAWALSKAGVLVTIALYAVAFAMMAAGWIATAAAAMAGAIATAAAWLVAIWPIALVIAAIAFVVFMVVKHWDTIKKKTKAAWDWVVAQVKKVPGLLVGFFMNFTLPGLIIRHWDKIKATFSAGVEAVVTYMKELPGKILDAIGDAKEWLLDVGKDIMRGLRDGIEAGFGWIREKLRGVGRVIPGWLKEVLGISSPSTVMRDEVGRWIPAGVAEGITDGMPGLHRAVGGMASAAVIPLPGNRIPVGLTRSGDRGRAGAAGDGGVLRMRIVNFDPLKDYIELVADDAMSAEAFRWGVTAS